MTLPNPAAARTAVLTLAVLFVPGCSDEPTRPKVALIGVDGATWTVIDPLLAAGRLPHMAALIERGSRSVLTKPSAHDASPVLWATIMTGTQPETHGILNFARAVDGEISVFASSDRKVPALWNMVDARGGTSGVMGVWNTWPAEHVAGYVVSDRFAHTLYKSNYSVHAVDDQWGITWPESLSVELAPFALDPDAIRRDDLETLGEFSDSEWMELLHGGKRQGPTVGNGLVALKFGWQATESVASASLHMLQQHPQPDLFISFLELPDRVGHHFWHAYEPEAVDGGVEAVEAEWRRRWSEIVPRAYERADAWLGRFVAELDPETTIIVVSDHGMQSSGDAGGRLQNLARVHHSGKHHDEGILIAAGPAIAPGVELPTDIIDVAPLVLAAMGLAPSTQFEGRLPAELLSQTFLSEHPRGKARSEPAQAPVAEQIAAPDLDKDYIDKLKAIGYLDADGGQTDDWRREQPAGPGAEDTAKDDDESAGVEDTR
jgi:arylsulfatase A-like enzyme